MVILYQTAKLKSTDTLAIAILGSTVKFNSRQYFWLYGNYYNSAQCSQCLLRMRENLKMKING